MTDAIAKYEQAGRLEPLGLAGRFGPHPGSERSGAGELLRADRLRLGLDAIRAAARDDAFFLGSSSPSAGDPGQPPAEIAPQENQVRPSRRAPRLAVFCDFDGTFAVQDVGSTLARRYATARRKELWPRLERGEFRAWDFNMELLDGLALPEEELEAFLRTVDLDPGARDLMAWCEKRGVPFRILSDGFDYNLDRLQEIQGVRFAYDANHLHYEDGVWRIAPSYPDPECGCGTGTCKRARIGEYRSCHPHALVVHIGNGRVSDLCAAEAADVVFAKDTLAEELERRGVRFEPFQTLLDVVRGLERLWGPE